MYYTLCMRAIGIEITKCMVVYNHELLLFTNYTYLTYFHRPGQL